MNVPDGSVQENVARKGRWVGEWVKGGNGFGTK